MGRTFLALPPRKLDAGLILRDDDGEAGSEIITRGVDAASPSPPSSSSRISRSSSDSPPESLLVVDFRRPDRPICPHNTFFRRLPRFDVRRFVCGAFAVDASARVMLLSCCVSCALVLPSGTDESCGRSAHHLDHPYAPRHHRRRVVNVRFPLSFLLFLLRIPRDGLTRTSSSGPCDPSPTPSRHTSTSSLLPLPVRLLLRRLGLDIMLLVLRRPPLRHSARDQLRDGLGCVPGCMLAVA